MIAHLSHALLIAFLLVCGCQSTSPRRHPDPQDSRRPAGLQTSWVADSQQEALPAHEDSKGDSELNSLLVAALKNNHHVKADYFRWQSMLSAIPYKRSLPDPKLSYGVFIQQLETRVGPQRQRFGLAQTIPWPGKIRTQSQKAGLEADLAWIQFQRSRYLLTQEFLTQYYEWYYLKKSEEYAQQSVDFLRQLEPVVENRVRAGASVNDLLLLQNQLTQEQIRLDSLQNILSPTQDFLASFMGLASPIDSPFSVPHSLTIPNHTFPQSSLESWLMESNPDLNSMQIQRQIAEMGFELSRMESIPDVTIGIDYLETGPSPIPGMMDSGKDPIMIHSSINIPINSRKYSSLQSKSKNTVYALKEDEENIRITQIARLKMAHSKLLNAISQVTELENSIIPVSQNSIDIAEQSYRSGILNIDQLINSRKNYLDALLLKNRSIVDAGIQLAELNFLTGGRLESPQLIPSHTPVSQLPYEN